MYMCGGVCRCWMCVQVRGCAGVCAGVRVHAGMGVCKCVSRCEGGSGRKGLEVGARKQEERGSGKKERRKASAFYKCLENILLHVSQNQQSLGPYQCAPDAWLTAPLGSQTRRISPRV